LLRGDDDLLECACARRFLGNGLARCKARRATACDQHQFGSIHRLSPECSGRAFLRKRMLPIHVCTVNAALARAAQVWTTGKIFWWRAMPLAARWQENNAEVW